MAWTFPLIAPVSCSNGMVPNALKHYETQENMSFWSNGVDWVRSLWKIPTWLRGTNFCINCSSSPRFAPSFLKLRNDPKCTQILRNRPKHLFWVQWGGLGVRSLRKITTWFVARTFVLIAPVHPVLHRVSCSYETIPNAPKHYETHQTHEFMVQWGGSGVFTMKNYNVTSWHELLY